MITHTLPGGGKYDIIHACNGITVCFDMSPSCTRRVQARLQALVQDFFESGEIRTFRLPTREPRYPEFMPWLKTRDGVFFLTFSDGSYIVLQGEDCYPGLVQRGIPGWRRGKRLEEYKANRFFSRLGEEKVKNALKRWAKGGALKIIAE